MKKMMLVLISTASVIFASAQIQFGIKAGYNLTNINFSYGTNASTKSSFNAGILASIPLFSRCFFQPEILYSSQGSRFPDAYVPGNIDFDYLNVPVLFKYQHSSGIFAETGPQFGFLFSAKNYSPNQTFDIKSQTQSTDFAWVFGIGCKLRMGLGLDARYNLGLTNIANGPDYNDGKAWNEVFQLGLFYVFSKL